MSSLSTTTGLPILAQAGALIAEITAQAQVAMTQATFNSAVFNPALKASSGWTQTAPSNNSTPYIIVLFIIIAVILILVFIKR